MTTSPIAPLQVANVGKIFGRRRALAGVSTAMNAGEITAILGPNGAGKSTLLAILSTLLSPTSGSVRWGDVELRRGSPSRAALGYVGHDPGLYMDLGALPNLTLFAALYGVPDGAARARALLTRVGLDDAPVDAPVRTFSRGMLQRLGLARALVHDPSILLFDEPSAALDPAGVTWLATELQRERDGGRVVVLVTHDLDAAASLAEHILILRRGRVVRDERRPGAWGAPALRAAYEESCHG
ncbi:MAG TPA: ABC transporter ATP-binding protein [Polyangia bacterium]|jgi:heme exporter protein A